MDFKVALPQEAEFIIRTLNHAGHEAYAVGGCVRDSFLGLIPGDWDIATSADPLTVKALFDKTIDTGIKHGTVTVLLPANKSGDARNKACGSYEVTTFRLDGLYEDFRHPVEVVFSGSLEEDLSRRDFTINAMAWHPDKGLTDPFGGMADISRETIRTVGAAGDRFKEDALRMLRAVRFSARFGFRLHEELLNGMKHNCSLIEKISKERIREELNGILFSDRPERLSHLMETGILHYILPELESCFNTPQNNPYHLFNVGEHSLVAAAAIENDLCLRWTMLLHDIGKPWTWTTDTDGIDHFHGHPGSSVELSLGIMRRLRFDNKSMQRIIRLVRYHDYFIKPEPEGVRKAMALIGSDIFQDLLKVKAADKLAQSPEFRAMGLDYVRRLGELYAETIKNGYCTSIRELAVNGHDLLSAGIPKGSEVKDTLTRLLNLVLEHPELNDKTRLLSLVNHFPRRN
ncbi:MAG: HD domain-containing protein [Clostridiales bacterium]|nr:HD domain-containing protein [Clostridiales bacterium]